MSAATRRTGRVRPWALAVLTAACLAPLSPSGLAAASADPASGGASSAAERALDRLRSDQPGVRVTPTPDGRVAFVATAVGHGLDPHPGATPATAAGSQLARYAPALGVDDPQRDLGRPEVTPAVAGGSVVRYQQRLAGLPVLGGQVVLTQAPDTALTSVLSHLSDASTVPLPRVSPATAARVARQVVARSQGRAPATTEVTDLGVWVLDPALVGEPAGPARPVRRYEVTAGPDVREMVLVDAVTGRLRLQVDQVAQVNRVVCDAANSYPTSLCRYGVKARTEGSAPVAQTQVNDAYDLLGATSDTYAEVAGLDLTTMIGLGNTSNPVALAATVRWCPQFGSCPLANAFWSGQEMYFGDGFASADDVVGHELTHGVIDRSSGLFYFHQSGAINESLADIMGEVTDHRTARAGEAPEAWLLGEDLPIGAIRSLADPTAYGQPDRMTSALYATHDVGVDNGDVHTNSGVGNKAAYLIAQGGTFNGVTVDGIDAADPTMTKTGTLYAAVAQRLTSGSQYSDLALVLPQTCTDLRATAGFTAADCDAVAGAVAATEMSSPPPVPGIDATPAPAGCPTGTAKRVVSPNTESVASFTWQTTPKRLWYRAPDTTQGIPANATSGTGSWFGWDPDPAAYGDPSSSYLQLKTPVALPDAQASYLRFTHWRAFEYLGGASPEYDDGGIVRLVVTQPSGASSVSDADGLPWDNGPRDPLRLSDPANPVLGFGGDSHGWTSSRVDLSSLAGRSVQPRFVVAGGQFGSAIGFLDDIEIYTCDRLAPSAPRSVAAVGKLGKVRFTWTAPANPGEGVTGYRITRVGGGTATVGASARAATFGPVPSGETATYRVEALGTSGSVGPAVSVTVSGATLTARPSTRVLSTRSAKVTIKGVLARADGTPVANRRVVLEARAKGTSGRFGSLGAVTTGPDGSYRFRIAPGTGRELRTRFAGGTSLMGVASPLLRFRLG